MNCKHKYKYIKEVDVPTGRYLVETEDAFEYRQLEDIPVTNSYLRKETTKAGLSVCEKCGDVVVKVLKLSQTKGGKDE